MMRPTGTPYAGGYAGRILFVDLNRREIERRELEPGLARGLVGSRGINGWLLRQHLRAGVDALAPENPLIFGLGPLTGTGYPTSARFTVTARSPLTGFFGDSNSGGYFGAELKAAGWDHIVLLGQADEPVVLWIRDQQVDILPADDLWGKNTWETTDALEQQAQDRRLRVACIGQAGERLVRFAAIMNERNRAAGRTGMGAVMGSKRLKAIAVRGSGRAGVADPAGFRRTARCAVDKIKADPGFESRSQFGTASLMKLLSHDGSDSTRNHQTGFFDGSQAIGPEALANNYWLERIGCFSCPIRCSHAYRVEDGAFAATEGEGPEYETLNALGSKLGIDDLPAILHANTLANQYGLDTMSLGTTISFAMECHEKGLLSAADTQGLDLTWGNARAMVMLVHQIARREGLGDLLAEGSLRAARAIGRSAERYAMQVKGMELPASDPRSSPAAGLSYAVSSRGADHLRAGFVKVEKKWKPADAVRLVGTAEAAIRQVPAGKGALVRWEENLSAVADSLGVCLFICSSLLAISMADMALAFSQATGWDVNEDELWSVGERIVTLERMINLDLGLTRADDRLPSRFSEEPLPSGAQPGRIADRIDEMVAEYYALRGWDAEGVPTPATLSSLGLPTGSADSYSGGMPGGRHEQQA